MIRAEGKPDVMGAMTTYEGWITTQGWSQTTVDSRLRFYTARVRDWGPIELVPFRDVTTWLYGYTGWSRVTYYNHLTSVYDWMVQEGVLDGNPMRSIQRPRSPAPAPRPLPEEQLVRALAAARPRTAAYVLLGYFAGLRAHEIAKFHGRDINQDEVYVLGKGGRPATIPTHPMLWELAAYHPRDGFWFPSSVTHREHVRPEAVTVAVSRLFSSVGIQGATHRARHTFGTNLLRQGANLRVVQDLMRHSSLATTARYLGTDDSERRAAINGLAA